MEAAVETGSGGLSAAGYQEMSDQVSIEKLVAGAQAEEVEPGALKLLQGVVKKSQPHRAGCDMYPKLLCSFHMNPPPAATCLSSTLLHHTCPTLSHTWTGAGLACMGCMLASARDGIKSTILHRHSLITLTRPHFLPHPQVQTGLERTGRMLASDWDGAKPDVLVPTHLHHTPPPHTSPHLRRCRRAWRAQDACLPATGTALSPTSWC